MAARATATSPITSARWRRAATHCTTSRGRRGHLQTGRRAAGGWTASRVRVAVWWASAEGLSEELRGQRHHSSGVVGCATAADWVW
eukprot:594945-Prymnesium_polylepis.1